MRVSMCVSDNKKRAGVGGEAPTTVSRPHPSSEGFHCCVFVRMFVCVRVCVFVRMCVLVSVYA